METAALLSTWAVFFFVWWIQTRRLKKRDKGFIARTLIGIAVGLVTAGIFAVAVVALLSGYAQEDDRLDAVTFGALTTAAIASLLAVGALSLIKALKRMVGPALQRAGSRRAERRENEAKRQRVDAEINALKKISGHQSKVQHDDIHKPTRKTKPTRTTWTHKADYEPEFYITYVDADGEETHREITVLHATKRQIEAYCHTRRDIRTFLVERVQDGVISLDTGEVLSKKAWVKSLQ